MSAQTEEYYVTYLAPWRYGDIVIATSVNEAWSIAQDEMSANRLRGLKDLRVIAVSKIPPFAFPPMEDV